MKMVANRREWRIRRFLRLSSADDIVDDLASMRVDHGMNHVNGHDDLCVTCGVTGRDDGVLHVRDVTRNTAFGPLRIDVANDSRHCGLKSEARLHVVTDLLNKETAVCLDVVVNVTHLRVAGGSELAVELASDVTHKLAEVPLR